MDETECKDELFTLTSKLFRLVNRPMRMTKPRRDYLRKLLLFEGLIQKPMEIGVLAMCPRVLKIPMIPKTLLPATFKDKALVMSQCRDLVDAILAICCYIIHKKCPRIVSLPYKNFGKKNVSLTLIAALSRARNIEV